MENSVSQGKLPGNSDSHRQETSTEWYNGWDFLKLKVQPRCRPYNEADHGMSEGWKADRLVEQCWIREITVGNEVGEIIRGQHKIGTCSLKWGTNFILRIMVNSQRGWEQESSMMWLTLLLIKAPCGCCVQNDATQTGVAVSRQVQKCRWNIR